MGQSIIQTLSKTDWESKLTQLPDPHPFAFSWVLDVLCPGSWLPLYDEETGAMLTLPVRTLGPFPLVSRQPFFLRSCGIYSPIPVEEKLVQRFWKALPPTLIQLHLYWNQPVPGRSVHPRIFQSLALKSDFSYKGNVRRNLKKAQQQALVPCTPSAIETDEAFFAYRGQNMQYLQGAPRRRMQQLMQEAEKRHAAVYFGWKDQEGHLHAAGFFIRTSQTLLFVHGGATEKGKKSGAMYLVMDQAVEYCKSESLSTLDFGGSNVPSVGDFYRGFGATDQTYYEVRAHWPLSF